MNKLVDGGGGPGWKKDTGWKKTAGQLDHPFPGVSRNKRTPNHCSNPPASNPAHEAKRLPTEGIKVPHRSPALPKRPCVSQWGPTHLPPAGRAARRLASPPPAGPARTATCRVHTGRVTPSPRGGSRAPSVHGLAGVCGGRQAVEGVTHGLWLARIQTQKRVDDAVPGNGWYGSTPIH